MPLLQDAARLEDPLRQATTLIAALVARDGGTTTISFEELENAREAEVHIRSDEYIGLGRQPGYIITLRKP